MTDKKYRDELIGKTVKVTKASNPTITGTEGTIIDETKHTLVIQTKTGRKRILKVGNTFLIDHKHKIKGATINVAPEERIKL